MKNEQYNFKVFDNYECDGQYTFDFTGEAVNIIEEQKTEKMSINDKTIQENINNKSFI